LPQNPPIVSEFLKGGKPRSGVIYEAEKKLEVVGSPYYNDSTSHDNSCIKRCPECGTVYLWKFEYEWFVDGSEEEITLTRLSEAEGEKAVQEVLENVKRSKQKFLNDAQAHLQKIENSTDQQQIKNTADFFYHHQLVHKEDISFAVPTLAKALVKHHHTEPKCDAGQSLYWTLLEFALKSETHKQQILDLLQTVNQNEKPPEVQELIQYCKQTQK
jgi:hypothetical protein